MPAENCDVLIAGGGPAGATMATLLARRGHRVVVLEKERHPRFHIGESLLPANVPLFESLGVRDAVDRIGMPKWGVEFCSPAHAHRTHVEFADAWDKTMPMAWQVRRADLDQILIRNAEASGAQVIEDCKVQSIVFDADGADVQAVHDGHGRRWRARYVVDATGRDTLLAGQFGSKQRNPVHNSAALFGHFDGAQWLDGKRAGNISIFWFEHGWFWFIPLADGSTSVGAVCWPHYLKSRDKPLRDFFADTIALSPLLAERLLGARLIDDKVYATGNYSYASSLSSGARYVMLGDAYAFVDPVFSSGVYLAMASAFKAVDVVERTLVAGPRRAVAARRRFDAHMRKGPRAFTWFIVRMTNPAMRELFMAPRNVLRAKEAVLSVLAGDIFGKTPIWPSLAFFKAIYYAGSLAALPRTLRAQRMRRQNIRDVGGVEEST